MEPADVNRMIAATAARLEKIVRPMDIVTRPAVDTFAVLMHQDSIEQCYGGGFRRVHQELNTVRVETMSGVRRINVVMAAGAGACLRRHPHRCGAGHLYAGASESGAPGQRYSGLCVGRLTPVACAEPVSFGYIGYIDVV